MLIDKIRSQRDDQSLDNHYIDNFNDSKDYCVFYLEIKLFIPKKRNLQIKLFYRIQIEIKMRIS